MRDIQYFSEKKMNAVCAKNFLNQLPPRLKEFANDSIPKNLYVLQGYKGPRQLLSDNQSGDNQSLQDNGGIQQIRVRYGFPKLLLITQAYIPIPVTAFQFFNHRFTWRSLFFDSSDGTFLNKDFNEAQNKKNSKAKQFLSIAQVLQNNGKIQEALEKYSAGYQICSNDQQTKRSLKQKQDLCKILVQKQNIQAEQYFKKAKELDRNYQKLSVIYKLAENANKLASKGYQKNKQLQQFIKKIRQRNQRYIVYYKQKGKQAQQDKDYKRAGSIYKQALQLIITDEKLITYFNHQICKCKKIEQQNIIKQAQILRQQGKLQQAIKYLCDFTPMNQANKQMKNLLARMNYQQGKNTNNLNIKQSFLEKAKNLHPSNIFFQAQFISNEANMEAQHFNLQGAESKIKQAEISFGNLPSLIDIKLKITIFRDSVQFLKKDLNNRAQNRSLKQRQQFQQFLNNINAYLQGKQNNQSLKIVKNAIQLRLQRVNYCDESNQLYNNLYDYQKIATILLKNIQNIRQQQQLIEKMGNLISIQVKEDLKKIMLQLEDQVNYIMSSKEYNKQLITEFGKTANNYDQRYNSILQTVKYEELIKQEAQIE